MLLLLFLSKFVSKRNNNSIFQQLEHERISTVSPGLQLEYYLSACVIVRESSDIMSEFLIRNYAAGVDHFFIYGDDDNLQEIGRLEALFAAVGGLVTYIKDGRGAPMDQEDPGKYVQMRMYRHCLQSFGHTSKWITLIDTDEFFETSSLPFSNDERADLPRKAFLHDILSTHEMFPILCVRWKTALTNGRLRPPEKGETLHDLFPRTCVVHVTSRDKLVLRKTILQPKFLDMDMSPKLDVAIHKGFFFTGRMKGLQCKWGIGHDLEPPIYVIHYWSRDLFSYLKKVRRGRPRRKIPMRNLDDLFSREGSCEIEEKAGSQDIRSLFLKTFLRNMPFYPVTAKELANATQAIGELKSSSTFSFCERRLSRLISEIGHGKDFSTTNYCSNRSSPACELRGKDAQLWPFVWAEYITNCEERVSEDSFFV